MQVQQPPKPMKDLIGTTLIVWGSSPNDVASATVYQRVLGLEEDVLWWNIRPARYFWWAAAQD